MQWTKILAHYGITTPIHLKEFAPHGKFKDVSHNQRRRLFVELVGAINEHKLMSLAATLASDTYHGVFDGVSDLSMYGACFANLVMFAGVGARRHTPNHLPLSYMLDDGNSYKKDIVETKTVFDKTDLAFGKMEFSTDSQLTALQAADVVTWAVRRRLSGQFAHGFEPLQALFDEHHFDFDYQEDWMRGVAAKLQARD